MKKQVQNNQHEEFELLRAGFSDQANLLAEDELGELFGGYQCGKNFCSPYYAKNDCKNLYCGSDFIFD
ncbi:MAG: hypothetical protein K2K88_00290 [Muribaculaceae bacterium]|nr:hypothetical protein [Muribaculaceae bacterium]MDE6351570.1 hypothetical protein [Muribaculaceae bacterium]